jgi:hypothetical protein
MSNRPILVALVVVCAASAVALRGQVAPAAPTPPPAAVPAKAPDAAPLYRAAVADLKRAFAEADGSPELPMAGGEAAPKLRFTEPEWAPLVAQASTALGTFAQAARLPGCDFGPAKDPMDIGYTELEIPLWHLALLTAAHGWQRLASLAPGEAAHDAATLLRHARHLGDEPSAFAVHVANEVERLGVSLLQASATTAEHGAKVLELCRRELTEHAERRGGRPQIVAHVQAEVRRMLRATVAAVQKAGGGAGGGAPQDELLRSRGAAVLARTEAIVDGWLLPLAASGEIDLPAALAVLGKQVAAARKDADPKTVRANLGNWPPERAVEASATIFALMLMPQVDELLTRHAAAGAELAACREALGPAATVESSK